MQPHLCGLGVAYCTPVPFVNGPAGPRLAPVTIEWHRAERNLALPTNINRIQVHKDGMEVGEARQSCVEDCMALARRPEFIFFLDYDVIGSLNAVERVATSNRQLTDTIALRDLATRSTLAIRSIVESLAMSNDAALGAALVVLMNSPAAGLGRLEYTLAKALLEYSLKDHRMEYTLRDERLEFTGDAP